MRGHADVRAKSQPGSASGNRLGDRDVRGSHSERELAGGRQLASKSALVPWPRGADSTQTKLGVMAGAERLLLAGAAIDHHFDRGLRWTSSTGLACSGIDSVGGIGAEVVQQRRVSPVHP